MSEKYKNMVLDCGCLDPSNDTAWEVAKKVMQFVNTNFDGEYVHLGAEANFNCWNTQPRIKEYMAKNNIASYQDLNTLWFNKLKSYLPGRKFIYYDKCLGADDVAHFVGTNPADLNSSSCPVILSPGNSAWLNLGLQPGSYKTMWTAMRANYKTFPDGIDKARIRGGEMLVWGEYINEDVLDNVVWPRAAIIARMLNTGEGLTNREAAYLLQEKQKKLRAMGIQAEPFGSLYC